MARPCGAYTAQHAQTSRDDGEYYLCALTELDTTLQYDATYLEQFIPASMKLTLGEGEKRTQGLRIGR